MERLSDTNGTFPQECFTCAARIYVDGEYCCDSTQIDERSVMLNVARYRPISCPKAVNESGRSMSAEVLLRKILKR